MLLRNYFVHDLKYSSMHFALGGLAEELSDALTASFCLLSTVFFPHTHPPTHAQQTFLCHVVGGV